MNSSMEEGRKCVSVFGKAFCLQERDAASLRAEEAAEEAAEAAKESRLLFGGWRGHRRSCLRAGGRRYCRLSGLRRVIGAFVNQRLYQRPCGGILAWHGGSRLGQRRESFALRKRKLVALSGDGRRAAAGLFFLVHHFLQAAVLEHYALAGLHAIDAAVEDAGDQNIRAFTPALSTQVSPCWPRRTLTSAAPGPPMRMRSPG